MEYQINIVAYRDWALDVYNNLTWNSSEYTFDGLSFNLIQNTADLLKSFRKRNKNKLYIFIGWSEFIPEVWIKKYPCFCIHPSPLPKYRGGSPIQNQILAGEETSAVTLFKMTKKLDAGPIFQKVNFSIKNLYLNQILNEISAISEDIIHNLLCSVQKNKFNVSKIKTTKQNEKDATYCKRRKPEESEINLDTDGIDIILRKVRGLQPPYPEAFIVLKDGQKLYIEAAHI